VLVLFLILRALRKLIPGSGSLFTRLTVYPWQHALHYRSGSFVKMLGPGVHWLGFRDAAAILPANEQETSVTAQEILTADRLQVKLSAMVVVRVADPRLAFESGVDRAPGQLGYTLLPALKVLDREIKLALRGIGTGRTLAALIENRLALDEDLAAALRPSMARIGLELVQAAVRDVILPAELRRAYSDAERARLEGLAALERARGEQASLRALANAARMLKNSPELMNLRVLQTVDGLDPKKNVTIVLGEGVMARLGSGPAGEADADTADTDTAD
jgi:regulator of protease activity HflC (stomatin/prohibitin superfamily)